MSINLTLSPDSMRLLLRKAMTVSNAVEDPFEDGRGSEVEFDAETLSDTHAHDGLTEEENDDFSREELRELIEDLNVDEAAELVAVVWIGRGDFDAADFAQAVEEAKDRAVGSTADYLLGMPLLPDHLASGLDALAV